MLGLKRLAQLQCLSGAKFGPKMQDMRTFYLGYVCSVLLYACPAWWPLLKSVQFQRLETLHRRAARIISGCTKAADNVSVLLEADLVPLDILARCRAAAYLEEAVRLPASHLRRRLYHSDILAGLRSTCHSACRLPITTQRQRCVFRVLPRSSTAFVDRVLISPVISGVSSTLPPVERRSVAQDALRSLPRATHELWTDGSVHAKSRRSGGAALLYCGSRHIFTTLTPAGALCTSFYAEAEALKGGLRAIIRSF